MGRRSQCKEKAVDVKVPAMKRSNREIKETTDIMNLRLMDMVKRQNPKAITVR
jgi:hypothetical protein